MRVSVFGLGYVGSVSAASFAADGHTVIGVDVNPDKVASLNEGRSPIVEKGLDELIRTASDNGLLSATTNTVEAVQSTDLSLLCVGTPSRKNGSLDLSYLERVCEQIGNGAGVEKLCRTRSLWWVVRSTVLPGTTHELVIPTLEKASGKQYGAGLRRHREPGVPPRRYHHSRFPQLPAALTTRRAQRLGLRAPTGRPQSREGKRPRSIRASARRR